MHMVSTLGFPSSNQLSGCTSRSWIREKMTMGPMAEIGWMIGPLKIQPVGEHQPGSQSRRQAIAVAMLPGRDHPGIDARPQRLGCRAEAGLQRLGSRRQTLLDPTPGHPALHQLLELARASALPSHHTAASIRSVVMHLTEEGHRAGVLDPNLDRSPDQPLVSFEDHDPITRRSAGQLARAVPSFTPGRGSALPFNQNCHLAADELAIVLQADGRLHRQEFVVPPLLDLLGNVVGEELIGLRPPPGTVLEDEAVLEPWLAPPGCTVRSNDSSVSPQKPTMKSLETATPGIVSRIRASISS